MRGDAERRGNDRAATPVVIFRLARCLIARGEDARHDFQA
jgi:hypothetical protein